MAHSEDERLQLGANLAKARNDAGLSMEGAATELTRRGYAVVKQTIGAWEKGRNLPDAIWLRRVAKLYGTSTDALVGLGSQGAWPFTLVDQDEILSLGEKELGIVEGAMLTALDRVRAPNAEDLARFAGAHFKGKPKPPKKRVA